MWPGLLQVAELADAAHGFVAADLAALCSEAALIALRGVVAARSGGAACITLADFRAAETLTRPSAMRELAVEVPKVRGEHLAMLTNPGRHGGTLAVCPPSAPTYPATMLAAGLLG